MKVQNHLNLKGTFQLLIAIGLLGSLFTFSSCQQESSADWSPTIAAPLVNSTLSVSSLLEQLTMDTMFSTDDEGLLSVNYRADLFDYTPSEIFNLEYGGDPILGEVVNTPFVENLINQNGEFEVNLPTSVFTFDPKIQDENVPEFDVKIDSLYLYNTSIVFNFSSTFGHAGRINIEIPHLYDTEGNSFDETIEWDADAENPITDSSVFDLDGYFLDMTKSEENDTMYNRFDIDLSVVVMNTLPNYDIEDDARLDFSIEVTNMNFELAYGDFGPGSFLLGRDTIAFNPFEDINNADFYLADPTVSLEINSGIGFQRMNSFVDTLVYVDPSEEINQILFNPSSIQPEINAPQEVGEYVTTFYKLTNEDGYISDLLSPMDKDLIYGIHAIINSNDEDEQSFIHRDHGISASLDVEIPLYGRVGNIEFNDTLEFDLGSQLSEIEDMIIKTNMESYFPVNAYLQVYFLDENYVLTDSLYGVDFDLPIITSPELSAEGRPINQEPVLTTKEASLTSETIANLVESKYLVLNYSFETSEFDQETNMKIFDDYYINAKVGFQATGKIDF